MNRSRIDLRGGAFRSVFAFSAVHWRRQTFRCAWLAAFFLLGTLADVLTPLFAGRLVDAIASGSPGDPATWNAAFMAFAALMALAIAALAFRHTAFMGVVTLTLRMMSDIGAGTFARVQHLSTDWHANSFAGSTVRKVTRGMWALDVLNDTILMALIPSLTMLIGTTILLGIYWPLMGLIVAVFSLIQIGMTLALTLFIVAPAATLSNAWDTRLGGTLADAVSCNAVVKAFGAETREESRLGKVFDKWRGRTRRTWVRGTYSSGPRGRPAPATSPSCSPRSSCCRAISATSAPMCATSNVR
jgi:ATP-binding cassette subfamily B protein